MKYLIGIVALVLALIFTSAAVYCGYRSFSDIYWGFVMIGLMFPDALLILIAAAGFSAAKEY